MYMVSERETVLQRMIRDIYRKCTGDFEVIVAFDGPPYQGLPDYPDLKILKMPESIGLKPCVNRMAGIATGKYLLKLDSHCMVSEGIDEILQEQMEWNWIVTPRFYVLDAENWQWQDDRFYDYFFLSCPFTDPKGFRFQAGGHWSERTLKRIFKYPLDETMQIHGSCWFVERSYFTDCLGGMSSEGYDTFGMEPPELCLKTWLGPWDGKVMVNKETWYAHMHKGGQRPRGYDLSNKRIWDSYTWTANYWMGNHWDDRVHDIEWLIERFWPVKTWPDNWKSIMREWHELNA